MARLWTELPLNTGWEDFDEITNLSRGFWKTHIFVERWMPADGNTIHDNGLVMMVMNLRAMLEWLREQQINGYLVAGKLRLQPCGYHRQLRFVFEKQDAADYFGQKFPEPVCE